VWFGVDVDVEKYGVEASEIDDLSSVTRLRTRTAPPRTGVTGP
jgi:hypothetical protein